MNVFYFCLLLLLSADNRWWYCFVWYRVRLKNRSDMGKRFAWNIHRNSTACTSMKLDWIVFGRLLRPAQYAGIDIVELSSWRKISNRISICVACYNVLQRIAVQIPEIFCIQYTHAVKVVYWKSNIYAYCASDTHARETTSREYVIFDSKPERCYGLSIE